MYVTISSTDWDKLIKLYVLRVISPKNNLDNLAKDTILLILSTIV